MRPNLHQLRRAQSCLLKEVMFLAPWAADRRDVLDTALAALDDAILREELYNDCTRLSHRYEMRTQFCTRCGVKDARH